MKTKSKRKVNKRKVSKRTAIKKRSSKRNPAIPLLSQSHQPLNIINFFPTKGEYGHYFFTRLYDRWLNFAKISYSINLNETVTTVGNLLDAIKLDRHNILKIKEYSYGDGFTISHDMMKAFQKLIEDLEQYPKDELIIIPRPVG